MMTSSFEWKKQEWDEKLQTKNEISITTGPISIKAQSILGLRELKFIQMRGHILFQEEIIMKYRKNTDQI